MTPGERTLAVVFVVMFVLAMYCSGIFSKKKGKFNTRVEIGPVEILR